MGLLEEQICGAICMQVSLFGSPCQKLLVSFFSLVFGLWMWMYCSCEKCIKHEISEHILWVTCKAWWVSIFDRWTLCPRGGPPEHYWWQRGIHKSWRGYELEGVGSCICINCCPILPQFSEAADPLWQVTSRYKAFPLWLKACNVPIRSCKIVAA